MKGKQIMCVTSAFWGQSREATRTKKGTKKTDAVVKHLSTTHLWLGPALD